ncbi:hypothetical protein [Arcobacter arenosus]|uniref:Uncharacterized protein n=1 Tax=Arcobacter arenosus TaxID=2576037 RepID=A0A5R8Y508_9BACT|nr:hypothetical protein [Arcobacter arenosus]TLP41068.1 hypothetical protein FDK22_03340 [Arcobacter arenosus]
MKISSNFNRLFWGTIINDIKQNLDYPIELNHKVFGYIKVDMRRLSKDSIHQLLKQLTNFPKDENFKAKSLTEVSNKDLVNHIELIKVMMNQNGFVFRADEEEWNRLINECKG